MCLPIPSRRQFSVIEEGEAGYVPPQPNLGFRSVPYGLSVANKVNLNRSNRLWAPHINLGRWGTHSRYAEITRRRWLNGSSSPTGCRRQEQLQVDQLHHKNLVRDSENRIKICRALDSPSCVFDTRDYMSLQRQSGQGRNTTIHTQMTEDVVFVVRELMEVSKYE